MQKTKTITKSFRLSRQPGRVGWFLAAALVFVQAVRVERGGAAVATMEKPRLRGVVRVEETRPKHFPHRIWAACDFEGRTPDYGWFGPPETNNVPRYPGNATALGVAVRPYQNFSALMTGINPVPGPRMGVWNRRQAIWR